MPTFRITPRARDDLISIGRYTQAQWGRSQRNLYLRKIEKRFDWLAANPHLGKDRSDVAADDYSLPEGLHVIFYMISEVGVDIIGVPHKSMDIITYFSSD